MTGNHSGAIKDVRDLQVVHDLPISCVELITKVQFALQYLARIVSRHYSFVRNKILQFWIHNGCSHLTHKRVLVLDNVETISANEHFTNSFFSKCPPE